VSLPYIDFDAAEKRQITPAMARSFGAVMIACGILLMVMMGFLIPWFAFVLWSNGESGTTFEGGPVMAAFIMGLFGAIFAFGLVAMKSGIYQSRHGKRDPNAVKWARIAVMACSALSVLVPLAEFISDLLN
jgi:hypothetical protein